MDKMSKPIDLFELLYINSMHNPMKFSNIGIDFVTNP
jgi:hypothetical protein